MERNTDVQVGTETEKHVDKLTDVCPRKKSHIVCLSLSSL